MIFNIIMSNGPGVPIREEKLAAFLEQANAGRKLIVTEHGVVNTSFIVSIAPHKEKMEYIADRMRFGLTKEEATRESLGASPFARILESPREQLGRG